MTEQPTPECGPACVEQHTYRLDGCALCCAEMHGSVAQPAWAVPCPDRRCQAPADLPCLRSDGSPAGVCHPARFTALDLARATAPPQDGPHAPQDGPQRPDAGVETPDGAGGRQTGTESVARLRRLRDQLAAEHAKAVAADQQPRPDLDHLRVTAHNGIAAGLETAIFFVDHHLREVGEQPVRTTVNNPAASGEAADNSLREQYAAAVECAIGLNVDCGGIEGVHRVRDAVLAVRDAELERAIQELAWYAAAESADAAAGSYALRAEAAEQQRDRLAAAVVRDQSALAQIRLHIAARRPRLQLADPILLGRLEAVLRQVGELEAAGGGEA